MYETIFEGTMLRCTCATNHSILHLLDQSSVPEGVIGIDCYAEIPTAEEHGSVHLWGEGGREGGREEGEERREDNTMVGALHVVPSCSAAVYRGGDTSLTHLAGLFLQPLHERFVALFSPGLDLSPERPLGRHSGHHLQLHLCTCNKGGRQVLISKPSCTTYTYQIWLSETSRNGSLNVRIHPPGLISGGSIVGSSHTLSAKVGCATVPPAVGCQGNKGTGDLTRLHYLIEAMIYDYNCTYVLLCWYASILRKAHQFQNPGPIRHRIRRQQAP